MQHPHRAVGVKGSGWRQQNCLGVELDSRAELGALEAFVPLRLEVVGLSVRHRGPVTASNWLAAGRLLWPQSAVCGLCEESFLANS